MLLGKLNQYLLKKIKCSSNPKGPLQKEKKETNYKIERLRKVKLKKYIQEPGMVYRAWQKNKKNI